MNQNITNEDDLQGNMLNEIMSDASDGIPTS